MLLLSCQFIVRKKLRFLNLERDHSAEFSRVFLRALTVFPESLNGKGQLHIGLSWISETKWCFSRFVMDF